MGYEIEFTPEPIDEWELACRRVANLLDDPEWSWLAPRIAKEKLTWERIFDIVASKIR